MITFLVEIPLNSDSIGRGSPGSTSGLNHNPRQSFHQPRYIMDPSQATSSPTYAQSQSSPSYDPSYTGSGLGHEQAPSVQYDTPTVTYLHNPSTFSRSYSSNHPPSKIDHTSSFSSSSSIDHSSRYPSQGDDHSSRYPLPGDDHSRHNHDILSRNDNHNDRSDQPMSGFKISHSKHMQVSRAKSQNYKEEHHRSPTTTPRPQIPEPMVYHHEPRHQDTERPITIRHFVKPTRPRSYGRDSKLFDNSLEVEKETLNQMFSHPISAYSQHQFYPSEAPAVRSYQYMYPSNNYELDPVSGHSSNFFDDYHAAATAAAFSEAAKNMDTDHHHLHHHHFSNDHNNFGFDFNHMNNVGEMNSPSMVPPLSTTHRFGEPYLSSASSMSEFLASSPPSSPFFYETGSNWLTTLAKKKK